MPELEELFELFSALLVIVIISVIVSLAWMSTYVSSEPVVTAIVYLQQETSQPTTPVSTPSSGTSPDRSSNMSSESTNSEQVSETLEANVSGSFVSSEENLSATDVKTPDTNDVNSCVDEVCISSSNISHEQNTEACFTPETNEVQDQSYVCESDLDTVLRKRIGKQVPEDSECSETEAGNQQSPDETTSSENITEIPNETPENLSPGSIQIKLKFLDDTQRLVCGLLSDSVGTFKRSNFESELSSNHAVRLIFNGRLLNEDQWTLSQYGFFNNCVVHCHIAEVQSANDENTSVRNRERDGGLDLSELLNPLLLGIIVFLWYLRYEYSYVFNTSATFILVCLTILLLVSQYALVISFNISFNYDNGSNSGESGHTFTRGFETAIQSGSSPAIDSTGTPEMSQPHPATEADESRIENLSGGCSLRVSVGANADLGSNSEAQNVDGSSVIIAS